MTTQRKRSLDGRPSRPPQPVIASTALAIVLATLWAYWPVSDHGAISFDDPRYVTANQHVQDGLGWAGVKWALTSRHAYNWHPLTWLSHMLDVELFGLDLGRHHLVSLAIHLSSALSLLALLFRLTKRWWRSVAVSSLFALHPAHVESVAWLSERKDVLSTLLLLLTLAAYAGYGARPAAGRYLLCLGLFVLGLMTKPMLVTVPFLLLLLDLWPLRRLSLEPDGEPWRSALPRLLVEKVPFLVLTAGSASATLWAQRPIIKDLESFALDQRLANAVVSYVRYLGKFLWPHDLAVFYPHPEGGWSAATVIAAAALLLTLTALALWKLRRRPYLAVGWLWYLGMLVPVIGVVQVGLQALADRYTYLPTVGLSLALIWGLADGVGDRRGVGRIVGLLIAALLLAQIPLARAQVLTWRDDVALFSQAFDATEGSFWAAYNLGLAHLKRAEREEARAAFEAALAADPEDVESLRHLGVLLEQEGRYDEALPYFERAVRVRPEDALALRDLGRTELNLGRPDAARVALEKATRLAPEDDEVLFLLGSSYVLLRRWQEALAVLLAAVEMRPDHAPTQNATGIVLAQLGRLQEALPYFRRASELDPGYVEARRNLEAAEAALR